MGFFLHFENGPNSSDMLFWFKKHFQKCITHGSSQKIDVYHATLKEALFSMGHGRHQFLRHYRHLYLFGNVFFFNVFQGRIQCAWNWMQFLKVKIITGP